MTTTTVIVIALIFFVLIGVCIFIYWLMKRSERRILAQGMSSTAVITGFSIERAAEVSSVEAGTVTEQFCVMLDLWDVTIGEVVQTSTACTNKAYKKNAIGSTLPVKYIKSQKQTGEMQYEILVLSEEEEWKKPTAKHLLIMIGGITGFFLLLLAAIYFL